MKRLILAAFMLSCAKNEAAQNVGASAGAATSANAIGSATASAVHDAPGAGGTHVEKLDAAEVEVPTGKSKLHVNWSLPDGTGINDDAPFDVRWGSSDGLVAPPSDIHGYGKQVQGGFDVPLDVMGDASGAQLAGDIGLVVCDVATHSVCVPIKRRLELTFAVGRGRNQGSVTLPLPRAMP